MKGIHILFAVLSLFVGGLQTVSASSLQIIPLDPRETIETSNKAGKVQKIKINHSVKGNDVYVECIIPGFSFVSDGKKKQAKEGEGHIHLHVNGQKVMDVNQAAFILKGLPKGKHDIKLELVHNNQKPYGIVETFTVEIK